MEFPVTIESQDEFDKLIGPRLTREREKYADYDELKTTIQTLTDEKSTLEQERDTAFAERDDALGKVGTYESEKELNRLRNEVAKTKGVPAAALRGSTKEELESHADELKPLITAPRGPVIPGQGQQPETKVDSAAAADREFANFLTGRTAD